MPLHFFNHRIERVARLHVYAAEAAPRREVIVILGAPPRPDGTPTPLLADRLAAGAELFHAHKARRVLVSGRPDEVAAMAPALERLGVPAAALLVDDGSYRTLDTFARARSAFELRSLLVVTNAFHLERALFLARALGLDAIGVAARERVPYSLAFRAKSRARETVARARAVIDVALQR